MKTGLEDALAECLDSLERGGRIEDCLARHPELAHELEPLLLTARDLLGVFGADPRPSFQRAARQRFLMAALRPQRGARLMVVPPPPRRFSLGWRWVPAAVGVPALTAAIALAVVLGLSGGGAGVGMGPGDLTVRAIVPAPSATETVPTAEPEEIDKLVAQLEVQLGQMQQQVAQGGVIQTETIQQLKDINQSLEQTLPASPPEAAEAASEQIAGLLDQQQQVLSTASEQGQVAPEAAGDVDEVMRIAGHIIEVLPPPTATPASTPTPASSETPVSSPTATSEGSATATATPASSPGPGAAGSETIVPLTPAP
jgi:hypothetical protein